MAQTPLYFRPPAESESLLIPVMRGCPHNKCTFCSLFKDIPFRILPLEDVLLQISSDAEEHGPELLPKITRIYLEGGDPLALETDRLLRIMRHAQNAFPALERFACYATAQSALRKTPAELKLLAAAGLRRVYVGVESGVDEILLATAKGCTRSDLIRAGKALRDADLENDVSMMLGIGGQEMSGRHARETAGLLNIIKPVSIRVSTFIPHYNTELGQDCLRGNFSLMGPHAILRELRLLVENINCATHLLCNHWSNFIPFEAYLPRNRDKVMAVINAALQLEESDFRPVGITETKI